MTATVLAVVMCLFGFLGDDCPGMPPPSSGGGSGNGCWIFCPADQQPVKKKDDGCPPAVMWMQPNYGTVTKTRDCPGFFGTGTVRYAYVNGDIADGWVADHSGLCGRGDAWVGGSGCG